MNNYNNINLLAERYGEFCGSIISKIINLSSEFTINYIDILYSGYKGLKSQTEPAIKNLIEKCQDKINDKQ